MFKQFIVQTNQRGLLFHKGSYVKRLMPGTYRYASWSKHEVELMNISEPFIVEGMDLNWFLQDEELVKELDVVRVRDDEYVLHEEDGQFVQLLKSGVYAFWNVVKSHAFRHFDMRQAQLGPEINPAIIRQLSPFVQSLEVSRYETGFLYFDQVLQQELSPGRYHFWKGPVTVTLQTVDGRQQHMDLLGQEMMTEDKVTLRLNVVCQYRIVQPHRVLEMKSFHDQLHICLQLVLREHIGALKLDELLKSKEETAAIILSRLQQQAEEWGVAFQSVGIKDVILPGDMKHILQTVLLAEKQAQANLITRREETASTRSLLNTAKLMDENKTLYRLKELEFLEKICDKIGSISVSGNGDLLERLHTLIGERRMGES